MKWYWQLAIVVFLIDHCINFMNFHVLHAEARELRKNHEYLVKRLETLETETHQLKLHCQ